MNSTYSLFSHPRSPHGNKLRRGILLSLLGFKNKYPGKQTLSLRRSETTAAIQRLLYQNEYNTNQLPFSSKCYNRPYGSAILLSLVSTFIFTTILLAERIDELKMPLDCLASLLCPHGCAMTLE